jgi:hypothetical protein
MLNAGRGQVLAGLWKRAMKSFYVIAHHAEEISLIRNVRNGTKRHADDGATSGSQCTLSPLMP